jgi:acetylglutamate kinase
VGAAGSARLLALGAAWQLVGVPAAGRALVRAAAADREDERTLAGVLLVKGGDRSVPMLAAALRAGSASVGLIEVLASIGSNRARAALAVAAETAAPAVAAAAADALRTLNDIPGSDP